MKIITGMHRSGTSLIAQLIHCAGADMGSVKTFYPADRWNPGGYYEQKDIHKINMPLINGHWWKFSYFFLPSKDTIVRRSEKYRKLIKQVGMAYEDKVVKENRFCLTLPAWQHHGVSIEKVLICIRSPEQVVASIRKRNHTTQKHGYHLWKVHNQRILEYTKTISTWIINYNNLLSRDHFEVELSAALKFLDIHSSPNFMSIMQKEIVQEGMNHYSKKGCKLPHDIQLLWDTLKLKHDKQFLVKNYE